MSDYRNLLTLDPGKTSFAWCVVVGNTLQDTGMITHTITNIDTLHAVVQRDRFIAELTEIFDDYAPDIVVIERFQQRPGMGGGAPAEYINVMIGVVLEFCCARGVNFRGVTASTWKNHMRLAYDPAPPKLPKLSKAERSALKGEALKARVAAEKARKQAVKRTHADRMGYPVSKSCVTAPILDHEFDAIGIAQWFREISVKKKLLPLFCKRIKCIWETRRADQIQAKNDAKARARKSKAKVKAKAVRK